ncbi:MAG: hypothetical protein ACLFNK_05405 [Candidatus Woesearchaeota archaeon]
MENDLESLVDELNQLQIDKKMPQWRYEEISERIDDIAMEIAESSLPIKYDLLRNLICSYEEQDIPTYSFIEAADNTERGMDFLQELLDNYEPGDAFDTVTVGDVELDTSGQIMTDFAYDRINDYLMVRRYGTEDEHDSLDQYSLDAMAEDPDVIADVADGASDDQVYGGCADADEGMQTKRYKELPGPLTDKVCDAKIMFYDVLPENVLNAVNDEVALSNLYETTSNDLLFYGNVSEMPSEIKERDARILYYGAMVEKDLFYPVLEEVAVDMGMDPGSPDFSATVGSLLHDLIHYQG